MFTSIFKMLGISFNKLGFIVILVSLCMLVFTNSCKKDEEPVIETGTMTDIDGNIYATVKIGNQWWMAENLKTKRYRNGDSINFVSEINYNLDSAKWNNIDSGAYCIISNSDSSSQNYQGKLFGFLYNGFTISDARNVAPAGWHIPSDVEWKNLELTLGMSASVVNEESWRGTDQANKLKLYTGWKTPSDIYAVWGTNESGFTALGGSCAMYNGVWGNPGTFSTGFWWTSTESNGSLFYRYMDYNKANVFRYFGLKSYGFSIRCVKD